MPIITGEVTGSTSAAQLPNVAGKYINLKARAANAGKVYVGHSNVVTKAAGTTTVTAGWELAAGQETGWLNISNLNTLYYITDGASDSLMYMVVS